MDEPHPKFNPLGVDEDYFLPVDDRFRNITGDTSSSYKEDVAYFTKNIMRVLKIPGESSTYLTPKVIALSTNRNAKRFDASRQDGPKPSDLGEHEPIPEDAIRREVVVMKDEKENP